MFMKTRDHHSLVHECLGPLSSIWQTLIPEVRGTRGKAFVLESRLAKCRKEVILYETQRSNEKNITGGDQQPLVSIIVSAFKAEKTIIRALDSLVHQSYHNKEIVIVDDGSPSRDETVALIKRFMLRHNNNLRIKLIPLPINTGFPAASRNAAITRASAGIVTFLDDDDMLDTQDSLAKLMVPHLKSKKLIASIGDFLICDSEGNPKKKQKARWDAGEIPVISWEMLFDMGTMLSSIALKKEFARMPYIKQHEDMGPYFEVVNEAARLQYQTGEAELVDTICLVPDAIYKYCQREGSSITRKNVSRLQAFEHISAALTYAFTLPSMKLIPDCDKYMKARYSKHLNEARDRVQGSSPEHVGALVKMLHAKWLRVEWVNEPIEAMRKQAVRSLWKSRAKAVIPSRLKRGIKKRFTLY